MHIIGSVECLNAWAGMPQVAVAVGPMQCMHVHLHTVIGYLLRAKALSRLVSQHVLEIRTSKQGDDHA